MTTDRQPGWMLRAYQAADTEATGWLAKRKLAWHRNARRADLRRAARLDADGEITDVEYACYAFYAIARMADGKPADRPDRFEGCETEWYEWMFDSPQIVEGIEWPKEKEDPTLGEYSRTFMIIANEVPDAQFNPGGNSGHIRWTRAMSATVERVRHQVESYGPLHGADRRITRIKTRYPMLFSVWAFLAALAVTAFIGYWAGGQRAP